MNLSEMYTDIIKEHGTSDRNKKHLPHANIVIEGKNPSCGDEIQLELQIEEGMIKDGAFTGASCAISQASVSIMLDLMRDKTAEEGKRLASLFLKMALRQPVSAEELEALQEAAALQNIADMPARVKCATLPWHTLLQALQTLDG